MEKKGTQNVFSLLFQKCIIIHTTRNEKWDNKRNARMLIFQRKEAI